ncbi:MAG: lipid A deacylase LpxR family protein [Kangiellaceae bacterium]|nr:lipid A deacylase LpxR family protein [Kangiellaceae bacterium]MCW9016698.1 lipid A deacylase LpxR family protein [Kangiellaceae bacterium]
MKNRVKRGLIALLVAMSGLVSSYALADEGENAPNNQTKVEQGSIGLPSGTIQAEKNPHRDWLWQSEVEPYDTGWALYIDNDMFTLRQEDQDYTGGFSLTLAGGRATQYDFSLDPILQKVDRWVGFDRLKNRSDRQLHSMEIGFTVFTPDSIDNESLQVGDRPYATLLYLSNTEESIDLANDTAWLSTFTIGVLGAPIISEIQTEVHKVFGSDEPVGWDNQISDGGELTFKYSLAKQTLYHFNYGGESNLEISTTKQLSVGYLTELSFGIAGRVGNFDTPWYSFRPHFNDYSEKSASLAGLSKQHEEFYFWGGLNLHLRAYNAFLQGQFRDSAVTYSAGEIRNLVAEGWLGITKQFRSGWRLSYLLRGQTSEVNVGQADRSVFWGGLILSKGW